MSEKRQRFFVQQCDSDGIEDGPLLPEGGTNNRLQAFQLAERLAKESGQMHSVGLYQLMDDGESWDCIKELGYETVE